MGGDGRVDEVTAEPPDARQRAVLVSTGEPAVADNIRDQNRRELPRLAHGANAEVARSPVNGLIMAALPRCTKEDVEAGSAGPACRLAGLSTPC